MHTASLKGGCKFVAADRRYEHTNGGLHREGVGSILSVERFKVIKKKITF